ncbi:MAG: O-antigen ligase family protein, partial [Chloroflexi bacterium]|nr:O-antigen ligase family protein [Chloroflexota bacterium]
AGARDFFDAVAAEPFSFWTDPDDRRINTGILNFSRLVLLREVMQAQADSQKAIWAAAFGWAALRQAPDPSRGQAQDAARGEGDPAFGGDSPQTQAVRTAAAIQMARDEWPWLGPLVFTRWQAEGERDPRAGFALFGLDGTPSPLGLPLMSEAAAKPVLTAGRYAPDDARIAYPSTWRVLSDGADAPQNDPSPVVVTFRGTRLDLTVRRGPYRGYLWVTIDGAPANSLPRDEQGRSFVVLYDPLAQAAEVTLARGLSDGEHRAEISAEGGWGQWPIASWTVARERDSLSLPTWLGVGLGAVAGAITWRVSASARRRVGAWARERGTRNAQQVVERAVWVGLFGSGALFYLSPNIALSWLLLALLALFTLWQPVGGLALIAFAIPFYVQPTSLGIGSYAVVEVVVVLCAAGYLGRGLVALMRSPRARAEHFWRTRASRLWRQLSVMDWVVLGWVACGVIGVMSAENVGVANREFRVVIVEPALYYAMIRASRANVRPLINAFLAGATVIAVKAVADWITQSDLIAAEGVLRARSVYFSPNNLALYLDRAVALALSLALFGRTRRAWYGAACAVMMLALYLTFAKGTWLIALPMALLFIGLTRGRKVLLGSLGVLALIVVSLLPIAGTERLRSLLDLSGGTGFIRLQLWQSALAMIRDHPLWGVGLDNFLYQYRTRYILPAAFAEPGLSHPHNILLDFWTRLGLPGVGLLLFMLTAFWRRARAVYRRLPEGDARALALGVMAAMVAALAHGLIDNSFFLVDLAFVLMLTLAVLERLWVEAQLISTA